MKRSVILLALPLLIGCTAKDNATPFALYTADGSRTSSCGDVGLLAAPTDIDMRVSISLVGGSGLHWDHGDGLSMGTVDAYGSFFVSRFLRVDAREGDEEAPSCVIDRNTVVDGILEGNPDPDGTYRTFKGELRFDYGIYDATQDCADLLEGEDRIADALPCTVSYDIEGSRD